MVTNTTIHHFKILFNEQQKHVTFQNTFLVARYKHKTLFSVQLLMKFPIFVQGYPKNKALH